MLSSLAVKLGQVLGLKYVEDLRTLMLTGAYFALVTAMWFLGWPALMLAWGSGSSLSLYGTLVVFVPAWLLLCYLSFLAAVATHNSIHCPIFVYRPLNKAFQVVLSLAYGHPVTSYVPGHNLSHHKYTQQRKDVMRTTKMRYSWHLLNGIVFFFKIGIDMIANDSNYFALQKKMGRPIVKQLELEQAILWSVTAVLLVWDWQRWLIVCFLPHAYAKFCIVSLNLLQHDGCDAESRYNFARNFTGKWLNFFCYNNGFHSIHHLHPGLHWSLLPERHERDLVSTGLMHPNLDQPYILTYIWQTFVYPGVRIDYEGKPWQPPPLEPDEPWFQDQPTETYSTGENN